MVPQFKSNLKHPRPSKQSNQEGNIIRFGGRGWGATEVQAQQPFILLVFVMCAECTIRGGPRRLPIKPQGCLVCNSSPLLNLFRRGILLPPANSRVNRARLHRPGVKWTGTKLPVRKTAFLCQVAFKAPKEYLGCIWFRFFWPDSELVYVVRSHLTLLRLRQLFFLRNFQVAIEYTF